jgi:hypothetical protein
MGAIRTKWQEFKKKYPDFEKSKLFKSDLGPEADAFEANLVECLKLAKALQQKLKERDMKGNSLKNAFKGYTGVMLDLKKVDPKKFGRIQADCTFQLDGNKAGLALCDVIDDIAKQRHFNFTL